MDSTTDSGSFTPCSLGGRAKLCNPGTALVAIILISLLCSGVHIEALSYDDSAQNTHDKFVYDLLPEPCSALNIFVILEYQREIFSALAVYILLWLSCRSWTTRPTSLLAAIEAGFTVTSLAGPRGIASK
jgi:hypothetical protein